MNKLCNGTFPRKWFGGSRNWAQDILFMSQIHVATTATAVILRIKIKSVYLFYFIFAISILKLVQHFMGFKPRVFCCGSRRSTNWATTTAHLMLLMRKFVTRFKWFCSILVQQWASKLLSKVFQRRSTRAKETKKEQMQIFQQNEKKLVRQRREQKKTETELTQP